MSHRALINGTAYEIGGGRTLVGGTGYKIDKGRTLVGGTAYNVDFFYIPPLSQCTPEQVQVAAKSGQAPNYWSIGDRIGIYINGTFGGLSLSGTYYAFILGFNHNSNIEGNNTVHFQIGKDSSGTDIAFVYNHGDNSTGFYFVSDVYTQIGWAGSVMRQTICPAFLSAMPLTWQNVIKPCTKYSDNVGNLKSASTAADVTSTSDKIWLLSEFEVYGFQKRANVAEQNYQRQYTYYANGNNRLRYYHTNTSKYANVWLRSCYAYSYVGYFCMISSGYDSNGAGHLHGRTSQGFSPCFMVG